MTDLTFYEKLLNVLSDISINIKPAYFWESWSFWLSIISTAAIIFTLYFLIKYTYATENMARATESMAKYQIIPAVDVNMIYDKNVNGGKTYFWFSNVSNLPGVIHLEYRKNDEKRQEAYKPLRIPPKIVRMKTATTFDFLQKEGDKFILYVSIRPSLEKTNIEFKFEKSYTFTQNQWNENSWSFPDPPLPAPFVRT